MNTLRTLAAFILICISTAAISQDAHLYFSLQQMPDQSWGVFVKPSDDITPSSRINLGTGQVTIVAPVGFEYSNLEDHGGSWVENARVDSPTEAPDKVYISFGFAADLPKLQLLPQTESLLFTFSADVPGMTFHLFDNNTDPFNAPNSMETNPGNEIGVLDFGTGKGMTAYRYAGNYEVEKVQAVAVSLTTEEDK